MSEPVQWLHTFNQKKMSQYNEVIGCTSYTSLRNFYVKKKKEIYNVSDLDQETEKINSTYREGLKLYEVRYGGN